MLYSFTGYTDGLQPYGGVLVIGTKIAGTTAFGGANNQGAIFVVDSTTGEDKTLYSFKGGKDGALPYAGLVYDGKTTGYGTTLEGGDPSCNAPQGCGTVFKVTKTGQETVLYAFTGGTADGERPQDSLLLDSKGNVYGTAELGGASGDGIVFEISPAGKETILHNFAGGADGSRPVAALISDTAGNLYGTTSMGGADSSGVVFKIDTKGNESVLYTFTGGADGQYPYAGVSLDSKGNLYGTTIFGGTATLGVFFKLAPNGMETVLHNFGGPDGEYPVASLLQDKKGNFYSTTELGGADNAGTVFEVVP